MSHIFVLFTYTLLTIVEYHICNKADAKQQNNGKQLHHISLLFN